MRAYFQNSFKKLEMKQDKITAEIRDMRGNTGPTLTQTSSYDAVQEIEELKKEVSQLKEQTEESDSILKFTPQTSLSPTTSFYQQIKKELGFITISDGKWTKVDVFQDKSTSSKIIGQAQYGETYAYTKKEDGYYYITLSQTMSGWIHGQFVRERN